MGARAVLDGLVGPRMAPMLPGSATGVSVDSIGGAARRWPFALILLCVEVSMLIWLCLRNLKHNLDKYLLAVLGIGLSVLLVSATLAGISAAKRAGLQPIRHMIGGDLAIVSGDLQLVPMAAGNGLSLSDSSLKLFHPTGLLKKLAGYKVTQTAFVPVYCKRSKQVITLCARSVVPDPGPIPTITVGKPLGPSDNGQPHILRTPGSVDLGPVGSYFSVRIPRFDPKAHTYDLASGADYDLKVVGSADTGWGLGTPIVPMDFISRVTGSEDVVWLGVEVNDYSKLDEMARQIQSLLPEYTVLTSEQVYERIDRSGAEIRKATASITALVIALGCVAVINTFLLLTQMRRREIAMLKVLGFRPSEIAAAFVIEGLAVNCIGASIGYFAGGLWPVLMGVAPSYSLATYGWLMALVVAVTVLSLIFPAIWSLRYSALEVMRNV